ncbi:hypothetical protein H6P81_001694 [Aristolochia fimbriata]|uniref:Probable purine permease n=1 Tax=Aristolochia fimbriata TaxID=158543 RepID=A0AAV7FBG7_ARIFI|nr:hypothetical protein H6P81_001694 [Aristolochia fimbriata]
MQHQNLLLNNKTNTSNSAGVYLPQFNRVLLVLKWHITLTLDLDSSALMLSSRSILLPLVEALQSTSARRWQWRFLVVLNSLLLLVGQAVATLLGRFYFDQGGKSKWMATLIQTAAFPILLIPLFLFPNEPSSSPAAPPASSSQASFPSYFYSSFSSCSSCSSSSTLICIYIFLGLLIAGDNLMYTYGLCYLPVSTYSLLCGTQLVFNVLFSYFLNSQKLTPFILNSIVLLTISTVLLATRSDESSDPKGISKGESVTGFICTLVASAIYSLILSIMQLTFEKVLKKETFWVVLEMQIHTSAVATFACIVGLFATGEWRTLEGEMDGFGKGRVSYVMVLIWTAVGWQICSVGVVGLIYVVSSLFSNVISTLAMPLAPAFAVIFLHEKIDVVKAMSVLLAVWGFTSYLYQQYLDDLETESITTITTDHSAEGSDVAAA